MGVETGGAWPYNIFYSRDAAVRVETGVREKVPEAKIEVVDNPDKIISLTGKPPSAGEVLVHLEIPLDKSVQVMTALLESSKEPQLNTP